jgi:type I restriction enzyme R subunit
MSIHHEINFEKEICQYLGSNGWPYKEGNATGYDRARVLFPADVVARVRETQPKAWDVLEKNHGAKASQVFLRGGNSRGRETRSLNQF